MGNKSFNKIADLANKWVEENDAKRVVIVIAAEATEVKEETTEQQINTLIAGNGKYIQKALEGVLKDNGKENILKGFINRAYTEVSLEKLIDLLGGEIIWGM